MKESQQKVVTTADEMISSTRNAAVRDIVVRGILSDLRSCRLGPGQTLTGENNQAALSFAPDTDGLQLSADNEVANLRIEASNGNRAIYNDTSMDSLGRLRLAGVTTVGQVQILAKDSVRSGHVEVDGLDIIAADARARRDRPHGFGVDVLQGAFTLWNMQANDKAVISASLTGLSAGRPAAPVLGSGIFVSGAGFKGGRLIVSQLETKAIYSDGKIAPGTPDAITGGVFTLYNAFVDIVRNLGPVTTYGVNDMALDNWGAVDRWIATDKITTYGPSGIGFVNFGFVNELTVTAPIETFGQGARAFNVYDGTVNAAEFDRLTTHADGAVGIQISQPVGRLVVRRGIETFGATGESLVKGVVVMLSAIGLSIKAGGSVREIDIDGGIVVNGKDIAPIEMRGAIGSLRIAGSMKTAG